MKIQLRQISDTAMKLENPDFEINIDRPTEKGGGGAGLMGGQYLAIGVGGCFCSTLFAAAQSRDIEIKGLKVDVNATLSEDLPKRFTDFDLSISYDFCSAEEEFPKLVRIAEKGCISVNTIKNGLNLTLNLA